MGGLETKIGGLFSYNFHVIGSKHDIVKHNFSKDSQNDIYKHSAYLYLL